VGLVALAIGCGAAAAAVPAVVVHVHARLAPVAGTTAAGQFDGALALGGGAVTPARRTAAIPRPGDQWRLAWRLSIPAAGGSKTATLLIHAAQGAGTVARLLCTACTTGASGTLTLTVSQALLIAASRAEVVVHSAAATLRGAIEVVTPTPLR
jgi:hypothetical protein